MQSLHLFGRPRLVADGREIDIRSKKGMALVAYLAAAPAHTASRETLAALLWPESDDERARANLRHLLYGLNKTPLGPWLDGLPDGVRLTPGEHQVDVIRFTSCLAASEWDTAVSHYGGEFLAGFHLPDSPPFMEWVRGRQAAYQQQMMAALQTLTQQSAAAGQWTAVAAYAQQQLALDNLHEPAWQQRMMALARHGRRREALAAYEALVRLLQMELGLAPMPETAQLAQQIRADTLPAGRETAVSIRDPAQTVLLAKVRQFWIEGVLEQSLHGAILIELGMEARPEALAYPWGMVLRRPSAPPQALPPGTPLDKLFYEHGQALLILGDPGSGKTTMLLELARAAIHRAERTAAAPVPVVLNLSSWGRSPKPLRDWLVDELNEKYLVPLRLGRQWLNQDQLLLLLDGLDEVKTENQADCVRAINQFRQAHGLVPIAVCSRTAEYEALATRLRLDTAVSLQPLTPAQIDRYVAAGGAMFTAVRQALAQDAVLQEMARSPLLLSIMTLAYRDLPAAALSGPASAAERRHELFATYVRQMGQRKGERFAYPLAQTERWLGWLAQKLARQEQTIFLLEMLQPAWLDSRRQRWMYALLTRPGGGVLIALLISGQSTFLLSGLLIGLMSGLLMGYKLDRAAAGVPRPRFYALPVGKTWLPLLALWVVFFTAVSLTYQGRLLFSDLALLAIFLTFLWLPFGLLLEWRDHKRTGRDDIQPVEQLTWSWSRARQTAVRGALVGCLGGFLLGGIIMLTVGVSTFEDIVAIIGPIMLLFGLPLGLAAGLLMGFSRDVIPLKTAPDQGFRLTLRLIVSGAAISALACGLLAALVTGLWAPDAASWLEVGFTAAFGGQLGLRFGLLVGLWFGGLDLFYHGVLRLMLWQTGNLPLRLIRFLDEAAHHLYLRKVGGGYIFIHQLLLAYFARLRTETAVSRPQID